MKVNNTISSIFKITILTICWIATAFGGLCVLFITVSLSASFLDYLLSFANIQPIFTSWVGRGALTLIWLIAAIKWWKHHKREIIRVSQFTPEQRKEYENDKLKKNESSEAWSNKISLILVIGLLLYLFGKSNVGYALISMFLGLTSKILNYKMLLWIIAFYVFYSVIQALNRISDNVYHGITEIKEKLDTIISQTERD